MSQAPSVTVATCQLGPVLGEPEANLRRVLEAVTTAADRGAQVVVLPELATSGYVFTDAVEARRYGERADGPTVSGLCGVARDRDLVVVVGFAELDEDDVLRNSAALIDADGPRATYRKVHLWDRERELFTPGDQPPPVVDTGYGRIAMVVCYDLEFPEWMRLAALAGADLVCAPTNWPGQRRADGQRPAEVIHIQAAAAANRIFVAACDRTGAERGVDWLAASAVVGPDGYPIVEAEPGGAEQLLLARCDLSAARDKRISPRNDVLADRRPALYGDLTSGGQPPR